MAGRSLIPWLALSLVIALSYNLAYERPSVAPREEAPPPREYRPPPVERQVEERPAPPPKPAWTVHMRDGPVLRSPLTEAAEWYVLGPPANVAVKKSDEVHEKPRQPPAIA